MRGAESLSVSFVLILIFAMIRSAFGEQLSTSIAGIVIPSTRSEKVKIFNAPVMIAPLITYRSPGTYSRAYTFGTSDNIPSSAIGVFLFIDAITDVYISMTNTEVLASPPPNPPIPAGTIVGNILQMGASSGGYPAPLNRHYRDRNIFYVPLTPASSHTVTVNLIKGINGTKEVTFKISCLGYIE